MPKPINVAWKAEGPSHFLSQALLSLAWNPLLDEKGSSLAAVLPLSYRKVFLRSLAYVPRDLGAIHAGPISL